MGEAKGVGDKIDALVCAIRMLVGQMQAEAEEGCCRASSGGASLPWWVPFGQLSAGGLYHEMGKNPSKYVQRR